MRGCTIKKRVLALFLAVAVMVPIMGNYGMIESKAQIRLNKKSVSVYVGKKVKLKVKGTKKKVTWKSKSKKIATVNKKGVVKGKKVGKTKITAKVGRKKLTCRVTVKKKKIDYKTAAPVKTNTQNTVTPKVTTSGPVNKPSASVSPSIVPTTSTTSTTPPVEPSAEPGTSVSPSATPETSVSPSVAPSESPVTEVTNPVFSVESGEFSEPFNLTLSAPEGSTIYYTTDGSIPLSEQEDDTTGTTSKNMDMDISTSNEEFKSADVTSQDVSKGVELSFAKKYSSICFKTPEGETDWSRYDSLQIEYTVNQVGQGSGTLGLQICPIYASATGSWVVDGGGNDTARVTEWRRDLNAGHGVINVSLSETSNISSVGRLMFGVYNDTAENPDIITIHSVVLTKESGTDGIPQKLDTNTYTSPINVKSRQGEANVLCSDTNIPFMYHPDENSSNSAFFPEVSAVPKATVIRAMAVGADGTKSDVVTKVYFVGNDLQNTYDNASVISIVTDPDNLLSKDIGIYRYGNWDNSGAEWERPADVTYIDEDGTIPFETRMGMRIHGGYTRRWGQKSMRLYFRDELGGLKNLKNYQLIPGATNFDKTSDTTKYKNFILRNGGNEYAYTKIQDAFIQSRVGDKAFTTQSTRPCVVFLNGEYWGIYNLTERYGDNYLETEFGVDKSNVVMFKNGQLDEGIESDALLYEELNAMADLDMTQSTNYEAFKDMVDIQSYIDYFATEAYIGNNDWPGNNFALWRTRTNDGTTYGDTKWRWMLFDTEFSMNLWGCDGNIGNPIEWAKSDRIFAAVSQNEEFQQAFADALMDLADDNFKADTACAKLDEMAELYRPLMTQYFARFGSSMGMYNSSIERMKTFLEGRRTAIISYINDSFGISVRN